MSNSKATIITCLTLLNFEDIMSAPKGMGSAVNESFANSLRTPPPPAQAEQSPAPDPALESSNVAPHSQPAVTPNQEQAQSSSMTRAKSSAQPQSPPGVSRRSVAPPSSKSSYSSFIQSPRSAKIISSA